MSAHSHSLPVKCSLADIAGTGGRHPDGIVDGADFVTFINSFAVGGSGIDALANIAGSGPTAQLPYGVIDGPDFIAFVNAFAQTPAVEPTWVASPIPF